MFSWTNALMLETRIETNGSVEKQVLLKPLINVFFNIALGNIQSMNVCVPFAFA